MIRLTAYVSGKVQMSGYRSRVVMAAKDLGLTGSVQNLPDGRVKVIAEGTEENVKRFETALEIKNDIIDVVDVKKELSDAAGDYADFYKLVGHGETDERLDSGIEHLKELVSVVKTGFGDIGGKMDEMIEKQDVMIGKQDVMIGKQDVMIGKQDVMIGKQDETLGELQGLRYDLKSYMNRRFEKIEDDLAELRTAMEQRGII